jgi:hypothetical protein
MFTIDKEFEIPIYSPVCHLCDHLTDGQKRECKAFPDGIPLDIWGGDNPHVKKYLGQENEILFSRIRR